MSDHLRQIVGALLRREDVTAAQWARAIEATAREPHEWMNGRPLLIGDVFGARAADHALAKVPAEPPRHRRRTWTVEEQVAAVEEQERRTEAWDAAQKEERRRLREATAA